jgi:hypothetical protein
MLMIEAVSSFKTSVNFYQITRRNIPEDRHLHTRRRENLKSRLSIEYQVIFLLLQFARIAPSVHQQGAS